MRKNLPVWVGTQKFPADIMKVIKGQLRLFTLEIKTNIKGIREVRCVRRVVIDMQNALFADAVAEALRRFDSSFDPVMSEGPDKTLTLCNTVLANVLIMEVTAYTPWKLEERLKLRDALKQRNPDCKIVLVVDENTEKKLADQVRQAKKDGLVDNFIYGSVSSTYLSAVIDAL